MQVTGSRFTVEAALAGNDLTTFPDFPAEIRAPAGTTYGVSAFQIHFGGVDVTTPGDEVDVLVAMNPAALKVDLKDLRRGGTIVVDTGAFSERNLSKAGFPANPIEDGSLAISGAHGRHHAAHGGGRQDLGPLDPRGAPLSQHVGPRPDALDVRPRPAGDHRLAAA